MILPSVTVTIKSQTIEVILKFLSTTGEAVSDGFENLFSVEIAASILGVADDNVNAEDNKKDEVLILSVTLKSVRILLTFSS